MTTPPIASPPASSPHLTVSQLAERWHKSPQAIYAMRHRGKAPRGFKTGVALLFPITEVEEFEARQMADDRLSQRNHTPEHRPAEALRGRHRVPVQRQRAA
jgi:predicted DNA-binding transcriptional regulator AlpA